MTGEKLVKLVPESECCHVPTEGRFCPRCGYEARLLGQDRKSDPLGYLGAPILQYARPAGGMPVLRLPSDVAQYLRTAVRTALDDPREHAFVLSLSAKNRLLVPPYLVAVGKGNSCDFAPREIFRFALVAGGTAIVVAHTHPSGDCTPSDEDKACTTRVQAAGTIVGVELLDHVIVAGAWREEETAKYFSFKEAGLL